MNVPAAELRLAEQLARRGARIQKANAEFAKLSPEKRRVKIAKDVLDTMAARKFIPSFATYATLSDENEEVCEACALGSMFLCVTGFENEVADGLSGLRMKEKLGGYFSAQQLSLIECAFERGHFGLAPLSDQRRAIDFEPDLTWPEQRLRAIMQNIVDNGGEFVP